MAKRVLEKDVIEFNELYLKYRTYAEVARQTGFSPSTIKRYIIPEYISKNNIVRIEFHKDELPEFTNNLFVGVKNWGDLCSLSKSEEEELYVFWDELTI